MIIKISFSLLFIILICAITSADIPHSMTIQGRVAVTGIPYQGKGRFKFAIVDNDISPSKTLWSNDGTSIAGSEPVAYVEVLVNGGIYSIDLGDAHIGGMTQFLTSDIFDVPAAFLRVWFSDGIHGFEKLSPERRFLSVPRAIHAAKAPSMKNAGGNPPIGSDGNIVSIFPRESIWPEHRGRGPNIVSYYATGKGNSFLIEDKNGNLARVPLGKRYIIREIRYGMTDAGTASMTLEAIKDGSPDITLISLQTDQVLTFNFKAGIAVEGGSSFRVTCSNSGNQQHITFSGFEYIP